MNRETYRHTADAWTVGQLRKALAAYPDDMPLQVAVPDQPAPADEQIVDEYIVTHVGIGKAKYTGRGWVDDEHVTVELDFPSGGYEREIDEP